MLVFFLILICLSQIGNSFGPKHANRIFFNKKLKGTGNPRDLGDEVTADANAEPSWLVELRRQQSKSSERRKRALDNFKTGELAELRSVLKPLEVITGAQSLVDDKEAVTPRGWALVCAFGIYPIYITIATWKTITDLVSSATERLR